MAIPQQRPVVSFPVPLHVVPSTWNSLVPFIWASPNGALPGAGLNPGPPLLSPLPEFALIHLSPLCLLRTA